MRIRWTPGPPRIWNSLTLISSISNIVSVTVQISERDCLMLNLLTQQSWLDS